MELLEPLESPTTIKLLDEQLINAKSLAQTSQNLQETSDLISQPISY